MVQKVAPLVQAGSSEFRCRDGQPDCDRRPSVRGLHSARLEMGMDRLGGHKY
jgi:hypothetical protein